MITERMRDRILKIKEHHKQAKDFLNGGEDPVGAQRELVGANNEQVELMQDQFEYLTRPFWERMGKLELFVIFLLFFMAGGREIVIWINKALELFSILS